VVEEEVKAMVMKNQTRQTKILGWLTKIIITNKYHSMKNQIKKIKWMMKMLDTTMMKIMSHTRENRKD
jgi:hypothetical protein